jgi:hypothetical protein
MGRKSKAQLEQEALTAPQPFDLEKEVERLYQKAKRIYKGEQNITMFAFTELWEYAEDGLSCNIPFAERYEIARKVIEENNNALRTDNKSAS